MKYQFKIQYFKIFYQDGHGNIVSGGIYEGDKNKVAHIGFLNSTPEFNFHHTAEVGRKDFLRSKLKITP